jgi:adenine-specific DNA-methyltransferase
MEADLFSASALRKLLAVAVNVGADFAEDWSASERQLAAKLPAADPSYVRLVRAEIRAGGDPLGEEFCRIRSPEQRRPQGATYTPPAIIEAMLGWAMRQGRAARVVDPGAGSGRFIVQAGRAMPEASLLAVEIDPVASLICRAHVAAAGMADRCEVKVADYRQVDLEPLGGDEQTLFIGNPPYVRHHLIEPGWKKWLASEGRKLGLRPSGLAGLHVHFLVATALKARPGDLVCFITSAEWLDVNYGRMVRELFTNGMGGDASFCCPPRRSRSPMPTRRRRSSAWRSGGSRIRFW